MGPSVCFQTWRTCRQSGELRHPKVGWLFPSLRPVVRDPGRPSRGAFLGLNTVGDTGERQACPQKGKTVAVSRPSKGKEPALLAVDPRRGGSWGLRPRPAMWLALRLRVPVVFRRVRSPLSCPCFVPVGVALGASVPS